jgi:toxin HigB-1
MAAVDGRGALEFGFKTKSLRRLCEQEACANRELGERAAAALRRRLADLEAVNALTELPWLAVAFSPGGEASIEFYPGYYLNVVAIRGGSPMPKNRELDWSTVDRLKVLGVTQP